MQSHDLDTQASHLRLYWNEFILRQTTILGMRRDVRILLVGDGEQLARRE